MREFLPSKKLFVFFIIPLLITTFIFAISKDSEKTKGVTQQINFKETQKDAELKGLDEHVKNWGISDDTKNLTETDKLARNFFSGFLELKQSDQLNTEKQTALMEAVIRNSLKENRAPEYRIGDLKITEDTDEEIEKYRKNMSGVLIKLFEIKEDETYILAKALQNKDDSQYKKLEFAIKIYKESIKDLVSTPTPQNASKIHLEIINNLYFLAENIQGISFFKNDPVMILKNIGGLKVTEKNLTGSFSKLNAYFKENQK